ncbi:membrane protein insertion efficiency factor YidD [Marivirga sp. S37H4]|uniref:Membrane protein insertion efficiency factor YidD n=1 Tax=Marivirga aurantiaca TaxID=2802615 RepID=A0A934X1X9_9BACT|nr:membrane protein insertion efficiency factor YidD [Marivirga aurantiaca]MBK6266806.1 membrane protein insertion efficiency factor YidD [Marivirga aurantiaca]
MLSLLNKKIFILLFLFFTHISSKGQSIIHDLDLIKSNNKKDVVIKEIEPEKKILQKINPLNILYTSSLTFYQKNISVQIAANCVFEKSCSHFSKDLTQEFGILGGVILSIDRLSRCNRISLLETSPLNFNKEGRIKESINDYRF